MVMSGAANDWIAIFVGHCFLVVHGHPDAIALAITAEAHFFHLEALLIGKEAHLVLSISAGSAKHSKSEGVHCLLNEKDSASDLSYENQFFTYQEKNSLVREIKINYKM